MAEPAAEGVREPSDDPGVALPEFASVL